MRISLLRRNEQRITGVLTGERVRAWCGIVLLVLFVPLLSFSELLQAEGPAGRSNDVQTAP